MIRCLIAVGGIMLALLNTGCHFRDPLPIPVDDRFICERFTIAPGTEDFVLDDHRGRSRLLISSHDRRNPETSGGIWSFDLATHESKELPRSGDPETLAAFKPHGMDIREAGAQTFLYVILHDPYAHNERSENAVAVYEIQADRLVFVQLLEDPEHLWSPNDLSVMASGEIYLTNDARGNFDIYFSRETSEIVYYDPATGKWKVAADGLAYANGILAEPGQVFVSATRGDRVIRYLRNYDGSLGEPEDIARVKGPDNLMRHGKYLLVTAHFDDLAFMDHKKDPEAPAPSVVLRIYPELYASTVIYVNKGDFISAASTAMIYQDKLYISQVFDPYLVVCDVPRYLD